MVLLSHMNKVLKSEMEYIKEHIDCEDIKIKSLDIDYGFSNIFKIVINYSFKGVDFSLSDGATNHSIKRRGEKWMIFLFEKRVRQASDEFISIITDRILSAEHYKWLI